MQPHSRFTIHDLRLRTDRKVQWIVAAGLMVQILFCITAVGFLHPDQHFQVIEFSSYQLGEASGATSVWELAGQIRPTLQIYLFSAFVKACRYCHVDDAYTQLTLLRFLFGMLSFTLFNLLGLYYFKNNRPILYLVLLLVNLSWTLPYIRTMFSSEMTGAVAFFAGLLVYEVTKNRKGFIFSLLTGLLFSFSFYLRFQMAFGIAGFGVWLLLVDKKYKNILPLLAGFGLGIAINCYLDYRFYHQFVFTPYAYYHANITEGKAAEFGKSSFMRYVLMLTLVIGTPPLSIFLFYYSLKTVIKQYYQPLVVITVFFIVGHCFIAHKEERFLFPILNVLPIIAGWALPSFTQYYQTAKQGIRKIVRGILVFSLVLNALVLVLLILNPYSQTVEFSRKLTNTFPNTNTTVYCLARTPFETQSSLPLTFYRNSAANIQLVKMYNNDSVRYLNNAYVVTTYNQAKEQLPLFDSLGMKPVLYSSAALWNINRFLQSRKMHTINDIWVLYKKE